MGVAVGADLQKDSDTHEPAAILLGLLLDGKRQLSGSYGSNQKLLWQEKGKAAFRGQTYG